jgi:hypothetical protein
MPIPKDQFFHLALMILKNREYLLVVLVQISLILRNHRKLKYFNLKTKETKNDII